MNKDSLGFVSRRLSAFFDFFMHMIYIFTSQFFNFFNNSILKIIANLYFFKTEDIVEDTTLDFLDHSHTLDTN